MVLPLFNHRPALSARFLRGPNPFPSSLNFFPPRRPAPFQLPESPVPSVFYLFTFFLKGKGLQDMLSLPPDPAVVTAAATPGSAPLGTGLLLPSRAGVGEDANSHGWQGQLEAGCPLPGAGATHPSFLLRAAAQAPPAGTQVAMSGQSNLVHIK